MRSKKRVTNQSELSTRYMEYSENFGDKRVNSPFKIRSKIHRYMHSSAVKACPQNSKSIADLGCGDGLLTVQLLNQGYERIVGTDISIKNIQTAKDNLKNLEKSDLKRIDFLVRDVVSSGFNDREFEVSLTCHVLEHLVSFESGLEEQKRISDRYVVVALPTAWSPISWTLLGGGNYWEHGRFGFLKLFYGFLRTTINFSLGRIGVDEKGYAGLDGVPHIFFFPGRIAKAMTSDHWEIESMRPQVQGFPWIYSTIRQGKSAGKTGFGTIFVLRRKA